MRTRLHLVVVLSLVAVLGAAARAAATPLTFQLSASDALASVSRTNAFIAALGRRAKGAKLVVGGFTFGGGTCADFGTVYQLGAVTVIDGPLALPTIVTTRKGRDAAALQTAFQAAGVATWTPPPLETDTSLPFWSPSSVPDGVRFAADALTYGGDAGLIGAAGDERVMLFRVNVISGPNSDGRYRFLLELRGRTSSNDNPEGMVAFAERRCFTFVDLEPTDVSALKQLTASRVTSSALRARLFYQLDDLEIDIARRDIAAAFKTLALYMSTVVSHVPEKLSPDRARRLTGGAFAVRRGLTFAPVTATCGNAMRETGEQCDGADLGGFGCSSLGFNSGTLVCTADCHFDTSGCLAAPVCGNGILELGEECDRGDANSDELPDACRTNCTRPRCGDHVIDSFEDCEGRDLQGETCITFGYDGGTLRCDEDCEYDDEHCTEDF